MIEMKTMTAEQWNEKYPMGTPVLYYPVRGDDFHRTTETRSEAWTLGHGDPVVKIVGQTGGVALWALRIIE
jgi:hypothetical protein